MTLYGVTRPQWVNNLHRAVKLHFSDIRLLQWQCRPVWPQRRPHVSRAVDWWPAKPFLAVWSVRWHQTGPGIENNGHILTLCKLHSLESFQGFFLVLDYSQNSPIAISFNTLRPRQNGHRFADDTFRCIFMNENVRISIKISLKFVPKGPINNIPAVVQIMAWRRSGDKPLSEPMMDSLPTHICVTRPQWVKIPIVTFDLEGQGQLNPHKTTGIFFPNLVDPAWNRWWVKSLELTHLCAQTHAHTQMDAGNDDQYLKAKLGSCNNHRSWIWSYVS